MRGPCGSVTTACPAGKFDSLELTEAIETGEFQVFLDNIPIAIAIAKLVSGDQRIVYANKAYEALTGQLYLAITLARLVALHIKSGERG